MITTSLKGIVLIMALSLFTSLVHTNKCVAQRYESEIFSDADILISGNIQYAQNYDFLSDPMNGILSPLNMVVYQPNQNVDTLQARPLIIYIHGGNFLPRGLNTRPTGGIDDSAAVELAMQWAKRGFVVATISYRLGWNQLSTNQEVRASTLMRAIYRAMIDVKSATRYFRKDVDQNANSYRIDPNKIVLFGEETGATIALATVTLDNYYKMLLPKLYDFNQVPPQPFIDTLVSGNIEGFGGSSNFDNHVGYSSEVAMAVVAGGYVIDSSWIEPGQTPVVSFHCVFDPIVPYEDGTLMVESTNELVLDIVGSSVFMRLFNDIGNNDAFITQSFNDSYTMAARSYHNLTFPYIYPAPNNFINTGSEEGLYSFILPLDPLNYRKSQFAPWQWWDTLNPHHTNGLFNNPDMSKTKALAYIDTMQNYMIPRIVSVLNTIVPQTPSNLVWPGDANNDLVVDNDDILTLGLYHGLSGSARDSVSNLWIGHSSTDWVDTIYNGANLKYSDCNGDGVINDADTVAIVLNYGLSHPRSGGINSRAGEPTLKLQPRDTSFAAGDTVMIDLLLGDDNNEVNGFYGISFDLNIDASIVELGTIQLTYNNSFVGNIEDNLTLSKIFENTGKVDGVIVRKNRQNVSGHGVIGTLRFVAKNSGEVPLNTSVTISEYNAVNATGNEVLFDVISEANFIVDVASSIEEKNIVLNTFSIQPNPFNHSTTISYVLNQSSQVQLKVFDVLGRELMETKPEKQNKGMHEIVLSNANAKGILIAELIIDGSKVMKRMVATE
jgi:hypothetical protein